MLNQGSTRTRFVLQWWVVAPVEGFDVHGAEEEFADDCHSRVVVERDFGRGTEAENPDLKSCTEISSIG